MHNSVECRAAYHGDCLEEVEVWRKTAQYQRLNTTSGSTPAGHCRDSCLHDHDHVYPFNHNFLSINIDDLVAGRH